MRELLNAARHERFVDREAEIGLFESALQAPQWPFQVLFVHGPVGVGKTELINEFAARCRSHAVPALRFDGRALGTSPEGWRQALRSCVEVDADRCVVAIDDYDPPAEVDAWLREAWLPDVQSSTLLVLASRHAAPTGWRNDVGWQALVQPVDLNPLPREESRALLALGDVPDDQQEAVLDFAGGLPLALVLAMDAFERDPDLRFQLEAVPRVVERLVAVTHDMAETPDERAALEVVAVASTITEDLLDAVLPGRDAHALFEWLRTRCFLSLETRGLRALDAVQHALSAELRWRNPRRHADLARRVGRYFLHRLRRTRGWEQDQVLMSLGEILRAAPRVARYFSGGSGDVPVSAAGPDDRDALLAMTAHHEGEEAAEQVGRWFDRHRSGFIVARDAADRPAGYALVVTLGVDEQEDRVRADPGVDAARRHLEATHPLRDGERALLLRAWMDRDAHQAVSPVQTCLFRQVIRTFLNTRGIAVTLLDTTAPELWGGLLQTFDCDRVPEADHHLGGRRHALFGMDWRRRVLTAWLDMVVTRPWGMVSTAETTDPDQDEVAVLSRSEFDRAVRAALRNYTDPSSLLRNPLLSAWCVLSRSPDDEPPGDRVEVLRDLLHETAESIGASPKLERYHRALHATWLDPEGTQEEVAEALRVPFSTYRRHLSRGFALLVDRLWQQELGRVAWDAWGAPSEH
ncbi:MAG: hypothetical protein ACQEXJ_14270 [Myxococcota bacterium]